MFKCNLNASNHDDNFFYYRKGTGRVLVICSLCKKRLEDYNSSIPWPEITQEEAIILNIMNK